VTTAGSASTSSDFSSIWSLYLWIGIGVAAIVFVAVGVILVRYRKTQN